MRLPLTHISRSRRAILACATLAALALAACGRQHPPGADSVEAAIFNDDWTRLGNAFPSASRVDEAVIRFVRAHAHVALNQSDLAFCEFNSASASEIARWESWARELTQRYPEQPHSHYFLGDALARQQKWSDAFDSFQKSLNRDPNFALALNARGVGRALTGDLDSALRDFQRAGEINPAMGDAYLNRGYAYLERHVATGARAAFDRALTLMPESALVTGGLSYIDVVENRWLDGKNKIETAATRSTCLAPLLASSLSRIIEWDNKAEATLVADSRSLGTTINEKISAIGPALSRGQYDVARDSVRQAIEIANSSNDPQVQKRLSLNLESLNRAYQNNSAAQNAIGGEVARFAAKTQEQRQMWSTVDKVEAQSTAGVDARVGIGSARSGQLSIDLKTGATVTTTKDGARLRQDNQKSIDFATELQKGVRPTTTPGGLTTAMPAAKRADWPITPHYTLAYRRVS